MTAEVIVSDLSIGLVSGDRIVDDVSFEINRGEVLGLVGESGSGKTAVAQALLAHARKGTQIMSGSVSVNGRDMLVLPPDELRIARGSVVSYIPQDPPSALNPALRIGAQLLEMLRTHWIDASEDERQARVREVMDEVALPNDQAFLNRFPHQLSGGQQQRVVIAMAFACRPTLIVCDEPTTGLDVTTQAKVLATMRAMTITYGASALYVSHDLATISQVADQVAVMYAGRVVESGSVEAVMLAPIHPYTRGLMASVPDFDGRRAPVGIPGKSPDLAARMIGCAFASRCAFSVEACRGEVPVAEAVSPGHLVRCLRIKDLPAQRSIGIPASPARGQGVLSSLKGMRVSYGGREVVRGVDLDLVEGECLALVGESGSGKTTLARCLAGLHDDYRGEVFYRGSVLERSARDRGALDRSKIQYVYQNPYASLNPRRTIGQSLTRHAELLRRGGGDSARAKVMEALEQVSLQPSMYRRYPGELSGGECQRVAIARALVAEPELLICDEITSALDVSVQASIVTLLETLQKERQLTVLFVTHNLALIRSIAQRLAVIRDGVCVEQGSADAILAAPADDYTRSLVSDTPVLRESLPPDR